MSEMVPHASWVESVRPSADAGGIKYVRFEDKRGIEAHRVNHLFFNPDQQSPVAGIWASIADGNALQMVMVPRPGCVDQLRAWNAKLSREGKMECFGEISGDAHILKKCGMEADGICLHIGSYSPKHGVNTYERVTFKDHAVRTFKQAVDAVMDDPIISINPNVGRALAEKMAETLMSVKMLSGGKAAYPVPPLL